MDGVRGRRPLRRFRAPEVSRAWFTLADDPRFNTAQARRDNNEALKHIIEDWLDGFPSRDAAVAALEAERVPCAPVLTLHEAIAHPHLRQRGTVRRVADKSIGEFDIPGLPVKFS
jgi:CoA:oxalate CoA-transferase